jgi:hypothetical protein
MQRWMDAQPPFPETGTRKSLAEFGLDEASVANDLRA